MQVILLQKVANLGNIGDRVKVRSGSGRNFLLPHGKATLATPENVARFEARRAELEHLAHEHLESAGERATATAYLLVLISQGGSHRTLPPGRYECDLIKKGGAWRFSRRTVFHDHDYTLEGIGR